MPVSIWTISELVEMFDKRRKNQFDCNILVTGGTGKGKSSFILKLLSRFDGFKQGEHQIYSREDTIRLLRDQKFSFCWNDELIEVGYKREHWNNLQIELIKTLTQYRCNFNIFAGALPVFFTLDKELLKLFAINIDVIKRGEAIIHMRKDGRRYSDDPWDTKHNAKLEESWSKMAQKNPKFKIPYQKYSTYVGHIYYNDITQAQRERYERIRDKKKTIIVEAKKEESEKSMPFYEKLLLLIEDKKIDETTFNNVCYLNNKTPQTVRNNLNQLLLKQGKNEKVRNLLKQNFVIENKNKEILNELDAF